jgi:alpha-ketoglutarate-dependent taurine dioxygenase
MTMEKYAAERLAVVEQISGHLFDHEDLSDRQRWRPGDLMAWDNRRVTRNATFCDDGHRRLLRHACGAGHDRVSS